MRLFRILLAIAILVPLMLVACTADEEPAEVEDVGEVAVEEADVEEEEAEVVEEEAEEVTLVDFGFPGAIQDMFRQNLAEPFMEEHPNVEVELLGGISEDAIAQIKAAQGASPIDTMLLGEPRYLQAANEGWILNLNEEMVPNVADVYPNLQAHCEREEGPNAVAWTIELVGLAYNPDIVPEPESWEDLWTNPAYEGQIGMAAPSSNAGYLFMMLIGKLFGEGEGDTEVIWERLDQLQPFVVASNPETLGQLLEREEIGVAINWSTEAAVTISEGFNVEFALPSPGAIAQVGCYGVIADTAHPEIAADYINSALGVDFQTAMSEPPYYFAPVNENVQISEESAVLLPAPEEYADLITIDFETALALREELTTEFTRRYGQ